MKTRVELKVTDQHLAIRKLPVIASGGQEEVELVFNFSDEWDDYIKMAVFTRVDDGDKLRSVKVILREDKCILPYEIYRNAGSFRVGAYGVFGESVKTSTYINIEVAPGASDKGKEPQTVTPDIFAQYAELLAGENRAILAEMEAMMDELTSECVSDERIAEAVSEYMAENSVSAGKSAYEYARDGGYTGTEEEFAEKLAAEYLTSESDPTVPNWAKQANKPTYTKSEVGLGSVDNVKQYSASNPPPYPVTSVNGKTGAVTITVPTKVSELTNDSEYITEDDVGTYILDAAEEWTFTLEDGSTVTKRVVVA